MQMRIEKPFVAAATAACLLISLQPVLSGINQQTTCFLYFAECLCVNLCHYYGCVNCEFV